MNPDRIVYAIHAAMEDLEARPDHPAPVTVCAYRPSLQETAIRVDVALPAEGFRRLFAGEVVTVEQTGRCIQLEYTTPDGAVRYTTHEMGPRQDSLTTTITLCRTSP